jgi:hypothetical protein
MIKDKFIPVTLGLISLACFLTGSYLMIFAFDLGISLILGFNFILLSLITAFAGLINGIFQMCKKKSSGLTTLGIVLTGIESCFFSYVLFMLAFFG